MTADKSMKNEQRDMHTRGISPPPHMTATKITHLNATGHNNNRSGYIRWHQSSLSECTHKSLVNQIPQVTTQHGCGIYGNIGGRGKFRNKIKKDRYQNQSCDDLQLTWPDSSISQHSQVTRSLPFTHKQADLPNKRTNTQNIT